ncbi:hypothetical protein K1719_044870 [Acacia pycnantha]|nr:hypothetical protein K1719_044870 [Acacia pycnantha]
MRTIFYWNCRGACHSRLVRNLRLAWTNSCPDILILAETKSENPSLVSRLESIGFDGNAFIPSVGRSGGLCAAWKSDRVDVEVMISNRQYFHLRISIEGMPDLLLTAIYSVLTPSLKQALWSDLRSMADSISSPWIVVGDFNDIASADERVGGSIINDARLKIFKDRIQDCMLSDLGSLGPKFTWRGPKLPNCPRLFQRLDRVQAHFWGILVTQGQRPFRFEAMWLKEITNGSQAME